jgi:hypothetical protein
VTPAERFRLVQTAKPIGRAVGELDSVVKPDKLDEDRPPLDENLYEISLQLAVGIGGLYAPDLLVASFFAVRSCRTMDPLPQPDRSCSESGFVGVSTPSISGTPLSPTDDSGC